MKSLPAMYIGMVWNVFLIFRLIPCGRKQNKALPQMKKKEESRMRREGRGEKNKKLIPYDLVGGAQKPKKTIKPK